MHYILFNNILQHFAKCPFNSVTQVHFHLLKVNFRGGSRSCEILLIVQSLKSFIFFQSHFLELPVVRQRVSFELGPLLLL